MLHMLVVGQVKQRHSHVHRYRIHTVHIQGRTCFHFIERESKNIWKTYFSRSCRLKLVCETAIHSIALK